MAKKAAVQRTAQPIRVRKVRLTASVRAITASIEKKMGLPVGSVSLVTPAGRRKNGNATIKSLWKSWV